MALTFKSSVRNVVLFLFPRYPFVNALTLLMLLAERASREKFPPFDPKAIYVNVGLLFAFAVAMGFNHGRRVAAILHAVQLVFLAAVTYMSNALQYRQAVRTRMANRMVGVAGFFLLFAYFVSQKPKPKLLRRLGELLVSVHLLVATYSILQTAEDREAFLKLVPGSQPMLFVFATLLVSIGLCYLPGLFVYDVTQVLIVVLSLMTVIIDMRMSYWTERRGLDYWNQLRLLLDNVAIIAGCVMYLSCSRKKFVPSDDDGGDLKED
jgi:ABC-type multidrug transport system fused ATPase/permease subunit